MYPELAEWLSTSSVDVICLQEVTATPGQSGWTTFTDGERTLPQRANLLADVRTLLPRHQPLFSPATLARSPTPTAAVTDKRSVSQHSSPIT